jgi:hypothetical protein
VVKDDYAKWMLDDPRVNFAISSRDLAPGVDHIGIQAEDRSELDEIAGRLKAAGAETFDQEATNCCYARSDKSWVRDPSGIRWETFYTFADAPTYGEDAELSAADNTAYCAPKAAPAAAAPAKACC